MTIEQPLLSICFPTRERPLVLEKTLGNIQDTLGGIVPIEICLRIDNDDAESFRVLNLEKFKQPYIKYIIGDRGLGYADIYKYWEDLYKLAKGTYILMWGDDTFIESRGNLFEILEKTKDLPALISPQKRPGYEMNVFPIIHPIILKWLKEKYIAEDYLFKNMVYIDGYFEGLRQYFNSTDTLPCLETTFKFHHFAPNQENFYNELEYTELLESSKNITILKNLPEYKGTSLMSHPGERVVSDFSYLEKRYREEFLK